MGFPITGSRAVLRERLRGTLEDDHDDSTNIDSAQIDAMSKADLMNRLRGLKMKVTSNKCDLRTRLKVALDINEGETSDKDGENDNGGNDDNESEESDEEDFVPTENQRRNEGTRTRSYPNLSFKDVEDSLESFSGDGTQNFQRWLTNFEETATLCDWTDVQKVIHAKRILRESAKLFLSFESKTNSWKKLKKSLAEEFASTVNSKQVHRKLSSVRKKADESSHRASPWNFYASRGCAKQNSCVCSPRSREERWNRRPNSGGTNERPGTIKNYPGRER